MRKLKRLTAVALSAAMIFSMSAFQSRATDTELGVKSAAEETAEESESTTEEAEVETTKETEEIETPAETEEPAKETDGVNPGSSRRERNRCSGGRDVSYFHRDTGRTPGVCEQCQCEEA